jgi:large subunit ribosomal protein L29
MMTGKLVHELNTDELNIKLKELKTELFNLRFRHATGQLANPLSLHTVKKDIARVKTILRERELKGEDVTAKAEVKTTLKKVEKKSEPKKTVVKSKA